MIAFLCSKCGKLLKVKEEAAGRKGRCPHCQQTMTVPTAAEAARASADEPSKTDAKPLPTAVSRGKTGLKGNTLDAGESLEDRLQREGKLPVAELFRIGKETAEGLAAAHERGTIHRDLKPANLWLEGDKGRVKILDAGAGQSARGESSGTVAGASAYLAPEQGAGKQVDPRCDLFSLGCVLYRMATGTLPFQGAATAERPTAPRKLNRELSPRTSRLIMELLAKDPKDRPPSALSVVDLLEELEHEPPAQTAVTNGPTRRARTFRADEDDTVLNDVEEWDEERPVKRSLLLPLLLGGGIGLFGLAIVAVGIFLLVRKTDAPAVVQNENPPIQEPVKDQRPINPNQNKVEIPERKNDPIRPPNADGGELKRNPAEGDPPAVPPKKDGPREADQKYKPYNSAVKRLLFAPDGKHFFSFGERNTRVDRWELATGKSVQTFDLGVPVHSCLLSADGSRLIAYNSGRLLAWDVDGGQTIAQTTAPAGWQIVGGGFTADKNVRTALAIKLPNAGSLHIFDNATNKLLMVNPAVKKPVPIQILHPAEVLQVFFGPDCKRLLSWSQDRMFRTWDLEAKRQVNTFTVSPGAAKSLAVSNDFKRVMGTFHEANVHLYDVDSGTEMKDIKPKDFASHTDAVAFGSESHLGVVGGFPGAIQVLDLDSGDIKKQLKSGAFVTAVALSPDGKTVLSGDMGGTVYIHKLDK